MGLHLFGQQVKAKIQMETMLPIHLTWMGECHDVMSIGLTRADATHCETCWDTNGLFALLNRIIFRLKEWQIPTLLANSLSRLINWCSINHSSFLNRFVAIVIYSSHALTKTQQNYVQIEKETGSRVWVRKVPSFCVWSNCRGRNRPQTPAVNLQQAATSSASETPTLSAATTEVWPASDLQARKVLVRRWHSESVIPPRDKRATCLRDRDKCDQSQVVFNHLTRKVRTVPTRNGKRLGTESPEQCDSQRMARQQRRCISSCQTVLVLQM